MDVDSPVEGDKVNPLADSSKHTNVAIATREPEGTSEPPRKKIVRDGDGQGRGGEATKPKWSNPDPYTVLPPTDEPQRKKKDVVKLLRKARKAVSRSDKPVNAVAANDDFISLDFDEAADSAQAGQVEDDLSDDTRRIQSKAPSGPRSLIRRDQLANEGNDGQPGSTKPAVTARSLGPPPGLLPARPTTGPVIDTWPPSNVNDALGNRKRTHDDEIKGSRPQVTAKGGLKAINGDVLREWRVLKGVAVNPWADIDHSQTSSVGFW